MPTWAKNNWQATSNSKPTPQDLDDLGNSHRLIGLPEQPTASIQVNYNNQEIVNLHRLVLTGAPGSILDLNGGAVTGAGYLEMQTPWISNIDGDGFKLLDAGGVVVGGTTPVMEGATPAPGRNSMSVIGSTEFGYLELASNREDADEVPIGQLLFSDGIIAAGSKGLAAINVIRSGGTALNRGSYMSFYTKADAAGLAERIRITNTGLIGINTNNPGFRLDVNGDCNVTGVYRVNGVPLSLSGGVPTTRQIISGTGLTGGGDLSADRTLSVVNNTSVQKVYAAVNGALVEAPAGVPVARNQLNFLAGSNVILSAVDDAGNQRINITINSTGTGGTGSPQTPWLSNIDAATFTLGNVSAIGIKNVAVPSWPLTVGSAALAAAVSSSQNFSLYSLLTPNTDQLQTYTIRDVAGDSWVNASWVMRRIIDGGSVRSGIKFGSYGVTVLGVDSEVLMAIDSAGVTSNKRLAVIRASGSAFWAETNLELQSSGSFGPRIAFHWSGLGFAQQFGVDSAGVFNCWDTAGTAWVPLRCSNIVASSINGLVIQSDVAYPTANQILKSGSNGVCYFSESYFQANVTITNNCGATTFNGLAIRDAGSTAPGAHQIMRTQVDAYLYTSYINYTPGVESPSIASVFVDNGDGFLRKAPAAYVAGNMNYHNSPHSNAMHLARTLIWKNYGTNYCIFDASANTSPDGTSLGTAGVGNKNAAVAWTPTYPTLMGWDGTSTFGVRVDSARIADIATTATNVSGMNNGTLTGYTLIKSSVVGVPTCDVSNENVSANNPYGDLRVLSACATSTHYIFSCYAAGTPRFLVRGDGVVYLYLNGAFKYLTIDVNGFVKGV